jgi:hypothetical protein
MYLFIFLMKKENKKTETPAQTGPTGIPPPLSHLQMGPTRQAFLPPRVVPRTAAAPCPSRPSRPRAPSRADPTSPHLPHALETAIYSPSSPPHNLPQSKL